jgi:hypothetical protein
MVPIGGGFEEHGLYSMASFFKSSRMGLKRIIHRGQEMLSAKPALRHDLVFSFDPKARV